MCMRLCRPVQACASATRVASLLASATPTRSLCWAGATLHGCASLPTTTTSSSSRSSCAVLPPTVFLCGSSAGGLRTTRLLLRPQTIKPNPNEATSGQFDKSFEKITETIESRLPFRQRHVAKGNIHDIPYGERSEREMYVEAEEDLTGREREKPAAQQARSYFSDEDLSPEALHVRSPLLKVAQNRDRQKYDKKILKTTAEPEAYYYPEVTKEERQRRHAMLGAGWAVVGVTAFVGLRRAAEYMRSAG